ncbi:MAG: hypothetical protein QNJ63_07105 [Calothrix sp. MO_192.B10]|nr:hypothetical protein [Calothrix sp. MO_192.B10]
MPKRLLVVESPGKVKKLSHILGTDWILRASCGGVTIRLFSNYTLSNLAKYFIL